MGQIVDGRFELLTLVASGGMGSIYRARDLVSGQLVAVKLLSSPGSGLPRFVLESRILSELEHPAIVRYVAHGVSAEGAPYLAMEWLEGEDLSRYLAREGARPVAEALDWIREAAEGLAVVHRRGVVHRDIKPSNVFLVAGSETQIKILDFGIARALHDEFSTSPGTMVGTPAYMAPEQARGDEEITPSADVYSLGCVLHECLTAKPLFSGRHLLGVLAKILVAPAPRLSALRADVSPALDALVAEMLSRDPRERPTDAGALVERLAALASDERTSVAVPGFLHPAPTPEKSLFCVLMIGAGGRDAPGVVEERGPDTAWQLRSIAMRHEARLELLREGSALLVFEAPGAANDLAAQAAACALKLSPLFPDTPMAIATGLGVNSSESPTGEVIDRVAALLQGDESGASAVPDTRSGVKLDSVTAGLIESRFELARDASGTVTVSRSRRDLGAPRTLLGKATACLGREGELSSLHALFVECVRDSRARAVIVTAAAGVGKSRLCQEFLVRGRNAKQPFQLWRAWADPTRSGARLGLVRQAVRAALRISESDPLAIAQQKVRARVARRLPPDQQLRVTEFLGELVGVPFPDEESVQLRAARQDSRLMGDQITRAWVDWVAGECARRPVLLVLDDVHWADSGSLQLIDAALRLAPKAPFMVLALGRREMQERFPELWRERAPEQVQLSALSGVACEALARSVLPESTPDDVVARIIERCAGNAFFLEELLRAEAEGQGAELPGTVLAMLHARLARLPALARQLLSTASVFGQSFWPAALERAWTSSAADQRIDETLELLLERDWLTLAHTTRFSGQTEFSFRHALIRDAAYTLLHEDERRVTHRRAAEWLEKSGEADAAVLAQHWELGGELSRASTCFQRAAQQAFASNDLTATLEHAERAVRCEARDLTLAEARLLQAEACNWLGDHDRAVGLGKQAMALFEARGVEENRIDRWAHAVEQVSWACAHLAKTEEVLQLGRQLLTKVPSKMSGVTAIALAHLTQHHITVGQTSAAVAIMDVVNERADPVIAQDPAVAAVVEFARWALAGVQGFVGVALQHAERAATYVATTGNDRLLLLMHGSLVGMREGLGDYEHAEQNYAVASAAEARVGAQHHALIANRGLLHLRLGQLEQAELVLRAGVAITRERGDRLLQCYCLAFLGHVLLAAGKSSAAESEALAALDLGDEWSPAQAYASAVLANALLAQGRTAEAEVAARRACNVLEQCDVEAGEAFIRLSFAEAAYANGQLRTARDAIRLAAERLLKSAAGLDDELRRKFLTRVAENARTLQLAREWGCDVEGHVAS